MGKISNVSPDLANLVEKMVAETTLGAVMNIEPLAISKQGMMIKVARANPTIEFKCNAPDTVFLYIYEAAFERLGEDQQKLLIREALNQIHFDGESGKITVIQPQLCMTVDGYSKWGQELIDCVVAGQTTIEEIAEEEKAAKEAQKAAKKS